MIGNETELAGWQPLEEMIPKEILCSLFEASASGLSIFDSIGGLTSGSHIRER